MLKTCFQQKQMHWKSASVLHYAENDAKTWKDVDIQSWEICMLMFTEEHWKASGYGNFH